MELMVVAGEASGDIHAAELIAALRRRHPELHVFGSGGDRMAAEGCEMLLHASDLAVVGLFEVAAHLPRIYGYYRRLRAEMLRRHPVGVILIDFPDFNLRLARAASHAGIPAVYFISPQLWAWREGRVDTIRRYVRRMICIFPFERDFYARHGIEVDEVGHPLVDRISAVKGHLPGREEFVRRNGLDPTATVIALLPGSRRREVDFHWNTLLEAARLLRSQRDVQFVLPSAPTLRAADLYQSVPLPDRSYIHVLENQTYDSMAYAAVALVASGTATVETALMGTPMVVFYRLSSWTYRVGHRWVRTPHYAMVNLVAGKAVVPELIQREFTATAIVNWTVKLLDDATYRRAMVENLDRVRQRLGAPGAIERAADAVDLALFPSNLASLTVP